MKAIEIISIPVTDQERAKEFYLKLGFNIVTEAAFGTQKWVQLGFPGDGASITLVNWFPKMLPGCIHGFVIKTDDIEKELAGLTAKGIEVGEIDNTPWGKFLPVKDPDGNALSFHQQ